MAQDSGNAGAVLMAFVLGAITGAAVALLVAPTSGEETRRYLETKAREGRDKASELVREGREYVEQQRDSLKAAVDRGREAYRQAREKEQA